MMFNTDQVRINSAVGFQMAEPVYATGRDVTCPGPIDQEAYLVVQQLFSSWGSIKGF